MPSTRQGPPMTIWQDPQPLYQDFSFGPQLAPSHSSPNVSLAPSTDPYKRPSPASSPHVPVDSGLFETTHFNPPDMYYQPASPTKKQPQQQQPYSFYAPIASTAQGTPIYAPYPAHLQQENIFPTPLYSDPSFASSNDFQHSMHGKRQSMENIQRVAKKPRLEEALEDGPLPEPQDIAVPDDDGGKPQLSYAQLIGLAILKSPDRRLTLSQIYDWIRTSFSYYQTAESGWTNSIRHNLSLNKAFVKRERPKDDPGKGNYWMIEDGMERQFLRDRSSRLPNSDPVPYMPGFPSDGHRPSTAPAIGHFSLPPKSSRPVETNKFPIDKEISSDATLPASDEISPKRDRDDNTTMLPPPKRMKPVVESVDDDDDVASTAEFNSSPPVVPVSRHNRTKSSPAHFHKRQSSNGGRPKSANTFKDSGFYSSIESSVPRVSTVGPLQLTSDPDRFERPSVKRSGRAEDEIARLRGSSFDPSPSKGRAEFKRPARYVSYAPENSSPLRLLEQNSRNPFTPGIKLQPLLRAPPTVSPNTTLRLHRENVRELVGTPAHGLAALVPDTFTGVSPGFNIHEDNNFEDAFNGRRTPHSNGSGGTARSKFDPFHSLFDEITFDNWIERGSPIKKSIISSAKRPTMHRAASALGALEDITGRRENVRLGSPIAIPPPRTPGGTKESPVKNPATPLPKLSEQDLWGTDSSEEDDFDLSKGQAIDLFKGFQTIGAGGKENEDTRPVASSAVSSATRKMPPPPPATNRSSRPALGRCSTNIV